MPKLTDTPKAFPEYWFQRYDFASSYDADSDVSGNQSGSVFVRGFKIALQKARNQFVPNCARVQKILELEPEELSPTNHRINTRQSGLRQARPDPSTFSRYSTNHQSHTTSSNTPEIDFNFPVRHEASLYLGF